jgi:hypothetical protein
VGRLLTFDAQGTRFGEVRVRRDPKCPVCGENAHDAVSDRSENAVLEEAGTSAS